MGQHKGAATLGAPQAMQELHSPKRLMNQFQHPHTTVCIPMITNNNNGWTAVWQRI